MTDQVVTLETAAKMLGGDKPYSRRTIQRMIAAGVLEARGRGQLRRVTVISIQAYLNGARIWDSDDRAATVRPTRTKPANGGRRYPSAMAERAALVVLTGRRPKQRASDS
jgi:hypothetical protein